MDTELFDLCKEVYKRKPDWIVSEYPNDWMMQQRVAGRAAMARLHPLYTSDYLLEKLPKELHKDGIIYYLNLSAKYGDEFKSNYVSPSGYLYLFLEPESDTSLKTLLNLVIALDDAKELS